MVVEELIVDGLQLTVEKLYLTTSNVMDLLDKISQKEPGEETAASPEGEQASGLVSQGANAVSHVASGVNSAASGLVQLGQTGAGRLASMAPGTTKTTETEAKEQKVCIKMVHVRTVTVHSVNAMMFDRPSSTLSLKGPPILFKDFSQSHGIQGAASVIQILGCC